MAEMRTVNNAVATLHSDIARDANRLPNAFKDAWSTFANEWHAFYTDHSGITGWMSRGTTPVYNKTQEYRQMVQQWRDRYVRQGGEPTSTALPEPAKSGIWPYVIGGSVAAGLLYVIFGGHDE